MTWTRAHDAWIAEHCEGLEVFEPEDWPADMPLVYGDYCRVPKYPTDPAACIRAAEAWKARRPNNRWWGVRHEGDHFAWACESNTGISERVAVNSGHGGGQSISAAIATALYTVTGGPA